MIKMASIVPQNLLYHIQKDNIHMALAHLVGEPGYEMYTDFYKKGRKASAFTILDNGVIEGSPMPIAKIIEKAELIKADEIVLPDVFKDDEATLTSVDNAIKWLEQRYKNIKNCPFRLMVVPQGKDKTSWLNCAEELIKRHGDKINTLGIPKHLVDTFKSRDARVDAIATLQRNPEIDIQGYDIHLLGCWTTPLEVLTIAKLSDQGDIPMVRSCDSAIAYVYARNNARFCDMDRPDKAPIDFKHGQCNETILRTNICSWYNVGALLPDNVIHI